MTAFSEQGLVRGPEKDARRRPLSMLRYQSLRQAIEQTRIQIADYRIIVSRLQQQFDGIILPLEQRMTLHVLQLTHQLIDHHDQNAMSLSDKSVLGLWIGDNVASLSEHPFADRQAVSDLAWRWRESLKREATGTPSSQANRQITAHHDVCAEEDPGEPARREGDRATRHQTHRPGRDAPGESPAKESEDPASTREAGTPDNRVGSVETRTLMAQLFRQLAAVLHPDREPDEQLKQVKDALMGQCLKARQEGDLATLLALHSEHVGGDELLSGVQMTRLLDSLEHQLHTLQNHLRHLRFGDTMQSMMIERYATHSEQDTTARFAHHATSLRVEIERLQALEDSVATAKGLGDALEQRRDKLLDRMAINEMTGF